MNRTVFTRVALILAVIFAVTMALLPKPPHMPIDQYGDKFEHMLAFATLALLAALSYPTARLFRIGERLSFLGALIEVLQSIPSLHRDCDIHDWIADTLAITVVLLLVWFTRRGRGARLN
jgi:VanZ family protein